MFNCPIRKETCIRKRCYFWVDSNCAILGIHKQLVEMTNRLDRLEKQQDKAGKIKESR